MGISDKYMDEAGGLFFDIPVTQVSFDEEGKILMGNKRALNVLPEWFGKPFNQINIFHILSDEILECVKNHQETKGVIYYNLKDKAVVHTVLPAHFDSYKSLLVVYTPIIGPDGAWAGNLLAACEVTDMQRENLQNEVSAQKLNALTDMFDVAHINYMPHTMTIDVFGGKSKYHIAGAPLESAIRYTTCPQDQQKVFDVFKRAAEDTSRSYSFNAMMVSQVRKESRFYNLKLIPICRPDGKFLYYTGWAIDLTDQFNELNRQKEQFAKKLNLLEAGQEQQDKNGLNQALSENMRKLLSNVAHDLRSPLNTILGFGELMAYSDSSEERQEYFRYVKDSSNQMMMMLINDILEMAHLEVGKVSFSFAETDMEAIAHNAYTAHQLAFESLPFEFLLHTPETPCTANTDGLRILEILDNYLTNAAKYTHSGSVTLSYEEADGGVCFHVTDTGVGIALENCEKVFNCFEMLDTQIQGNGIGLYICREIAKGLGGKVACRSEKGIGSDFTLWIPRR